jgi:hypothetical protein
VGRVDGRPVRCISARLQLEHHRGYEPDEIDYHDMQLLAEAFALEPPPEYGEPPGWIHRRRASVSRAVTLRTLDADRWHAPSGFVDALAKRRRSVIDRATRGLM